MAFFPRSFYNNGNDASASFTPLFRLLDDFDSYSRQSGSPQGGRSALPTWQPKFDVREVANAYELHGELPGITKENVNIEFTEPQTMLIRGKTERNYSAGTSPNGHAEDAAISGPITEQGEEQPKGSPRQATVEDEADSETHESGFEEVVASKKTKEEPSSSVQKAQPADKAKYWLTERSIGEFSRSFNFPSRVDQDNVSASFKDGILTVVVPKAKKHEARRIAIH